MLDIFKYIQLAIIQAFTALWERKFEEMVAILKFCYIIKFSVNSQIEKPHLKGFFLLESF